MICISLSLQPKPFALRSFHGEHKRRRKKGRNKYRRRDPFALCDFNHLY